MPIAASATATAANAVSRNIVKRRSAIDAPMTAVIGSIFAIGSSRSIDATSRRSVGANAIGSPDVRTAIVNSSTACCA